MSGLTFLGLAAAFCSTVAFMPQLIKVWRTRSTQDISREMFLLIVAGTILWLAYGIIRQDVPLIVADFASLVSAATILYFKVRHG